MRKIVYVFLIGFSYLMSGCKPGVPMDVIGPTEMEEILYDYHIAQAVAETSGDSVNIRRFRYVQAVFDKHGITEAEFDSTMIWYSKHAVYLQSIYNNLRERYSSEVAALGAVKGGNDVFTDLTMQGDTANIWHEYPFTVLKPHFTEDKLLFTMTPDTTFKKGDSFVWRLNTRFISEKRKRNDAVVALYMKFENDSVVGTTQKIYSEGKIEIKLEGDTSLNIKRLGGYVYLKKKEDDKDAKLLLLDNIQLIRMHSNLVPKIEIINEESDIPSDSINVVSDTIKVDNTVTTEHHRMTPTELRDSRNVEKTINVVKEKPLKTQRRRRK